MKSALSLVFCAAVMCLAGSRLWTPGSLDSAPSRWDAATAPMPGPAELDHVQRLLATAQPHAAARMDAQDPPATIEELRERIQAVLAQHNVPGVGLALVTRDKVVWAGGVGMANREVGMPVSGDTVFRIGSITKTFISLAVLKLVEDGRLRLDARVADIAPEIAMQNPWEDEQPITVAHLLEHSAGFDDMRFNESLIPRDEASQEESPLADVLGRNPRSRVSRWQPGSRFAYANPGYTVAAYIIEKVTGEPFERYIEREVLSPLGMQSARFGRTPEIESRLAQGYGGKRGRPVPYLGLYHRPAGSLMASPAELGLLVKMFLDRGITERGPLISDASLRRMERSETVALPRLKGSYGLGNYGDPSLPAFTRGHDGGLPGFISQYRYAPDLGVGYVILLNSTSPSVAYVFYEIQHLVFGFMTRDKALPEPPTIALPPDELARYAGYYELASPRQEISAFIERALLGVEVMQEGGTLHMKVGNGGRLALVPTEAGRFRFGGHSEAAVAFTTTPNGRRALVLGDLYYEEGNALRGKGERQLLTTVTSVLNTGAFWNLIWIPGWLWAWVRFRQRFPLPPSSLSALASLCFVAMTAMFEAGWETGELGRVSVYSLGFFALSLLFPLLSGAGVWRAFLAARKRNRFVHAVCDELVEESGFIMSIYQPGWRGIAYDIGAASASLAMSMYLLAHGIIGLRTWAW